MFLRREYRNNACAWVLIAIVNIKHSWSLIVTAVLPLGEKSGGDAGEDGAMSMGWLRGLDARAPNHAANSMHTGFL